MFDIYLYKNRAEPNRVDKTPYLELQAIISGELRNETSVLTPVIMIENVDNIFIVDDNKRYVTSDNLRIKYSSNIVNLLECNYCWIPSFNRYYTITDIVSYRNRLWSLSMGVDVLMSYKNEIFDIDVFCIRQEYEVNGKIPDNELPTNITKNIIFNENIGIPFGSLGYAFQFASFRNIDSSKYCFVVTVLDTEGTKTSAYGSLTTANSIHYLMNYRQIVKLYKLLNSTSFDTNQSFYLTNPGESIVNIIAYPITFFLDGESVYLENRTDYSITDVINIPGGSLSKDLKFIDESFYKITRTAADVIHIGKYEIKNFYGDDKYFLNFTPYSKYELYLPFSGWVTLDLNLYFESIANIESDFYKPVIYIDLLFNLGSVNCEYNIYIEYTTYNENNEYISVRYPIMNVPFNLGAELALSYNNNNDIARNLAINNITLSRDIGNRSDEITRQTANIAIDAAAGAAKTGFQSMLELDKTFDTGIDTMANMLKGTTNLLAYASTSERNMTSAYNISNISAMDLNINKGTVSAGLIGLLTEFRDIMIKITRPIIPFDETQFKEYRHLVGSPSSYVGKLGNLRGYSVLGGFQTENISTATLSEKNAIESVLKTGVLMPNKYE